MSYRKIKNCNGGIWDGDFSLYNCRLAEKEGEGYLLGALKKGDIKTFASGLKGALEIKKIMKKDPNYGEPQGLEKFYEVLKKNNLGVYEEMYTFDMNAIKKKQARGAKRFIELYPKPIFLVTTGGSVGAKAAADYFCMTDFVSNNTVFENGKLAGVELIMLDGEDKLRLTEKMLSKYGLKIEECFVVGDSRNDEPSLEAAMVPCASPYAEENIIKLVDDMNGIKIRKHIWNFF